MSKETSDAGVCIGCGMLITHMDYHVPHCEPLRIALSKLATKESRKIAAGR